jgi:hypothetical protein
MEILLAIEVVIEMLLAYFTQKRVSEGTMRCDRQRDEEGEQYTVPPHPMR